MFPAASTATNLTWVITPSIGTTSTTTTAGFQVTFTVAGTYSISLSSTDPANGTVTTNAIQVFIVNCGLPARPEHAVWCYQRSVHLDFTTGIALSTPPNSSISNPLSPFSSTSQCDPITGNLHFYTDGIRVWNNSNVLIGNITNANYGSNIKGTISVPNPNNFNANPQTRTNSYYIFTVPAYGQSGNGSLVFGEVAINAGIAGLISSNNTLPAGIFNTNVVEAITAIPHCNGIDTWIIVHEINSSNTISYLLSGSGISLAVQNSSLPFINSNPGPSRHRFTIESAPHGDAMAIFNWANETVYFYSFNNTNGQMTYTSSVVIPQGSANTQLHGSFAPNTGGGSYFYYAVNSSTNSLYQIELPTLNAPIIQNIPFSLGSPLRQLDGSIQLGPDNLIYLSSFTQNNFGDSKMLVIRAPNVSGPGVAGCNPVVNLNNFTIGQRNFFSLPNLADATRNPSLSLDFLAVASICSTYTFSVGACWS
ncbi:MAG: hypothetical protein IPK10_19240 [Bacteroidetes bacterium]|nr:hypothetical protein [Bacteroidota bacterium]